MLGGSRSREDPGGHEGYGKNRVASDIQLDGAVGGVTFGRIVGKGECRAGVRAHGEPHVGPPLVVMDDIGWDVVDGAVLRAVLLGEDAADDGDGVTDGSADIEAKNDGNAGLHVRQDSSVDVRAPETKGLIARLTDPTNHPLGGEEVGSGGKGNGLGCGRGRSESSDIRHGNPVVVVPRVHVSHTCPDGDLGARADTGVLLEESCTSDLQVDAEQIRVEVCAARDGSLHVEATANPPLKNRSADRGGWQGANDAEAAIGCACEVLNLAQSIC